MKQMMIFSEFRRRSSVPILIIGFLIYGAYQFFQKNDMQNAIICGSIALFAGLVTLILYLKERFRLWKEQQIDAMSKKYLAIADNMQMMSEDFGLGKFFLIQENRIQSGVNIKMVQQDCKKPMLLARVIESEYLSKMHHVVERALIEQNKSE